MAAQVPSSHEIASSPLPAAVSVPTTNGPTHPAGRSPKTTSLRPLRSTAPSTIGTSRRNESRAAASRVSPRNRPALIVTPERETPGEREALRESEEQPLAHGEVRDVCPLGALVGPPQHAGEYRQQDRDLPRLTEMILDHALEGGADDRRRDAGDDDQPGDLLVRTDDRAPAEAV